MSINLYGLKNCDTCRKAQKALEAAGKTVIFRDVRADPVEKTRLADWLEAAGSKKLLNVRSTTWRGLEPVEKGTLDDDNVLTLLENYPTLIKRPIIEANNQIYVGWSRSEQTALLS